MYTQSPLQNSFLCRQIGRGLFECSAEMVQRSLSAGLGHLPRLLDHPLQLIPRLSVKRLHQSPP